MSVCNAFYSFMFLHIQGMFLTKICNSGLSHNQLRSLLFLLVCPKYYQKMKYFADFTVLSVNQNFVVATS